ncbi:MAG: S8 family serine peptidase, partial [Rubrobacteraceae bacterium]
AGQTIAVLDTGVDGTHPFLAGKVVEEACYSDGEDCPNGEDTQTGTGAAAPCMYAPGGCDHGTHVAGIAAGEDAGMGFSGVARGADIMAIQVFSQRTGSDCEDEDGNADEDPCTRTFTSDQMAALERVYAVRNEHDIAAVNMSLGSGEHTEACDSEFPGLRAIMNNLYSVGIATVVASGNDGHKNAVAAPACLSTSVAVGSTTDDDDVSDFSNSGEPLSFLAPGSSVVSAVPGGGYDSKSGTSMAAPHVAGAYAILKEVNPAMSLLDIHRFLLANGTAVTDERTGGSITRMRIDLTDRSTFEVNSTDFRSRFGWFQEIQTQEGIRSVYVDDGCNERECTLKEAIEIANVMPNFGDPDVIEFDVPGEGVRNFVLGTDYLPTITDSVVIDGYTQPGASANTSPLDAGSNADPRIELSGLYSGLRIATSDATIRGLVINPATTVNSVGFGAAIGVRGSGNVLAGNFLGTDPEGEKRNDDDFFQYGVHVVTGSGNIIGGTAAEDRNVISGNFGADVRLAEGNIAGTEIRGNYIGTNAAGTAPVDERFPTGISAVGGAPVGFPPIFLTDTTIVGNLISGHSQSEISLSGHGMRGGRVHGNLIGTKRDGQTAMYPDSDTSGTAVNVSESRDIEVGGSEPGEANILAFKATGVAVDGPNNDPDNRGDRIEISANSIHSNGDLGIDLGRNTGIDRNDPLDADTGPNEQQNYPVISSASISGDDASVSGTLPSMPNTAFRIEFFANENCDRFAFGEGQSFIGATDVTTDANGDASFGPLSFPAPSGQEAITATATDPNGNTSEFSRCITATINSPPTATDDSYAVDGGQTLSVPDGPTDILANDTDPDDDPLTALKATDPTDGTLALDANGSFTYTPDPGFTGGDSFTYKATDGASESNVATVEISVGDATAPAPTITSVSPEDGDADVPRDASIIATFSKDMDEASVEAAGVFGVVKDGAGAGVAASVEYDAATRKATLDPDTDLESGATYTATVTTGAEDTAGNALAENKVWSFTVGEADATAPGTFITFGPPTLTRSASATFDFSSTETGSTFECSLDGAAFTACPPPKTFSNLASRSHIFRVRATDSSGNTDPTPASRTWTVDAVKPTITAVKPIPNSSTRLRNVGIRATVSDSRSDLAKADIRLVVDGTARGGFAYDRATDRLSFNASKLSLGRHTVRITATDEAGNVATRQWSFTVKKRR